MSHNIPALALSLLAMALTDLSALCSASESGRIDTATFEQLLADVDTAGTRQPHPFTQLLGVLAARPDPHGQHRFRVVMVPHSRVCSDMPPRPTSSSFRGW